MRTQFNACHQCHIILRPSTFISEQNYCLVTIHGCLILLVWNFLSCFMVIRYFVAVNAAVCAYTTLSLLLSMVGKTGKSSLAILIILLDLVFLVLLSSGIGAGSAVGVLGAKGNTHVGWKKVCNYYGKFCRHVAASLLVSFVGMVGLLLLIILAVLNVYRRR